MCVCPRAGEQASEVECVCACVCINGRRTRFKSPPPFAEAAARTKRQHTVSGANPREAAERPGLVVWRACPVTCYPVR